MDNYIAIIRKADFLDLFKYGSLYINGDVTIRFNFDISELPNRIDIFAELMRHSNPFDYTVEYLFIHYTKDTNLSTHVYIKDIQGIYPLDDQAQTELSSLDTRIKIKKPLWPSNILKLQKQNTLENGKMGIHNIWEIYKLQDSIDSIEKYIGQSTLEEVVDELYNNKRPNGKLSFWVYAMRYDRHEYYPNNTIGFFMDTINVIFNYKSQKEVEYSKFENTKIMKFLNYFKQKPDEEKKFDNIIATIPKEESIKKLVDETKEIEPDFDIIKATTLFFLYRARYNKGFKYEEDYYKYGYKYGLEFSIACYLLGFVLGHEHTYDCLYSTQNIPIFKDGDDSNIDTVPTRSEHQIIQDKEPTTPNHTAVDEESVVVESKYTSSADKTEEVRNRNILKTDNNSKAKIPKKAKSQGVLPFKTENAPFEEPTLAEKAQTETSTKRYKKKESSSITTDGRSQVLTEKEKGNGNRIKK